MEILHHISFNSLSSQDFLNSIVDLGVNLKIVELPGGGGRLISFDISESDPIWDTVFFYLKKYLGFDLYRGGDIVETYFSDDEIRNAEWLRVVPTFEQGYPQPKGNWPIKQLSLINICSSCGIYEQNNSLRLYKEPRLGSKSFMALIGLGELFGTPEVFSELKKFEARGCEAWDAIIHGTKQPSERVRQLYISEVCRPGLVNTEKARQVLCYKCGITKYYPHTRGLMYINRDSFPSGIDLMKTHEWFGSGLFAFREIIVSNRVAQLILDKGWQGIRLKVVELI